jgi:Flp pilus assembly protein TadG
MCMHYSFPGSAWERTARQAPPAGMGITGGRASRPVRSQAEPGNEKRARPGVAATEFALVLPFLALMCAVAVDYCRIFYVTQTVQNSACVGAMYASGTSTNPNAASPTAAAQQAAVAEASALNPALDPSKVTVTYQGNQAIVNVQYSFQPLTPLMGGGGPVVITRSATMGMAPVGP